MTVWTTQHCTHRDLCCCAWYCLHGCFFFSSRRRHTRCLSDWSSDVCSSDLDAGAGADQRLELGVRPAAQQRNQAANERSEERRVGKECRSRWWAYHEKKKGEIDVAMRRC